MAKWSSSIDEDAPQNPGLVMHIATLWDDDIEDIRKVSNRSQGSSTDRGDLVLQHGWWVESPENRGNVLRPQILKLSRTSIVLPQTLIVPLSGREVDPRTKTLI